MLVFDLNNKESFNNLSKWERNCADNGLDLKNSIVFVIGNKCDIK